MQRKRLTASGALALLLVLVLAPTVSLAHERRTVGGGKYEIVVGWDTEPAYLSQKNAASIRISRAGTNPAEAVTGAEKTLKVEIRQGATSRTFPLRAAFGQPGYYLADILPTRAGDFQWTFTGTIGEDPLSEKFDTADGKFNTVEAATDLQFPSSVPDPAQVAADVQAARAAAASAQTLGVIGVGLGALALLAAIALWLTRPRGASLGLGSSRRATGERLS